MVHLGQIGQEEVVNVWLVEMELIKKCRKCGKQFKQTRYNKHPICYECDNGSYNRCNGGR